jgi:microcystin-dependent protein
MSDPFLGEIRLLAFPRIPVDWAACNGQTLSVANYNALFALIGTAYGGDGVNNFGVPNLNGRVPIGQGVGTGLTARTIGQTGGTETVALTIAQLPMHNHTFQATTAADSTGKVGPTVMFAGDTTSKEKHYVYPVPTSPAPIQKAFATTAIDMQGGNQSHDNVMPGLGLSYCICTNGIWPQNPNS